MKTREEIQKRIAVIENRISALLEDVQGCPGGAGIVGEINAGAVMNLDAELSSLRRQLRGLPA